MAKGKGKSRSLTVLLLKGEAEGPGDFIRQEKLTPEVSVYPLEIISTVKAELFVKSTNPKPPKWAGFFADYVEPQRLGLVSSAAAALVLHVGDAWFALTFGYGLYLLRPDRIVDGFGLRTTLNAVDQEELRSIDKETFDAIANQSRQQAPRGATAGEFGIDVERDLLKAVMGRPRQDTRLGPRLYGKDALAVSAKTTLDRVPELLNRLLKLYQDTRYRKTFRWVDDIKRVTDENRTAQLDNQLFDAIRKGNIDSTWLAPPDVLDWADIRLFSYSDSRRARVYTDIHWRTLLRNFRAQLSRDSLKRKRVYCYSDDDVPIRRWSAYDCIYAQLESEAGTYVLTGGNWYRLATEFVAEVDQWFASFPKVEDVLPKYRHKSEAAYNTAVSVESSGHYALLDRKLIRYGRARDPVEFCDLLGRDGEIIHVKRYSGSSGLSHLFSQGLVSGELLLVDQNFRDALKEKVPNTHWADCKLKSGRAKGRRITFAIVYRSTGDFLLPFFSKISLRRAAQRLKGFGYPVTLARVDVDQEWARLEKLKDQALG